MTRERIRTALLGPEDAFSLGVFRAWFGLLLTWEAVYLWRVDFAGHFLSRPPILFPYGWFEWLPRPSETVARVIVVALIIAGAALAAGYRSRLAAGFYALGFGYLFALDRAIYNNHLYLVVLLAALMAAMPLDASFAFRREGVRETAPGWARWALRAQLIIVYFYGGLAKVNDDWLSHFEPARAIAASKGLDGELVLWILTYGGLVFDVLVGPALLWRRTRPYALAAAVAFNVTNAWLFDDINIFPFMMLGALVLFIEPSTIRRLAKRPPLKRKKQRKKSALPTWEEHRALLVGGALFFAVQLLMPWRHLLLPGPVDWTGEAQRFSWRMKIQHRRIEKLQYRIYDYDRRKIILTDKRALTNFGFNLDQQTKLAEDPDALQRMARFLADDHRARHGASKVEVKADVVVVFNGHPAQAWVDPEVDLSGARPGWTTHREWILPLEAYQADVSR